MTVADDTIAAIATAPGEAGIAIVRVSGPGSLSIADRLIRGVHPLPSQQAGPRLARGFIRSGETSAPSPDIDEVVLLIFRAPHSYTREDVVEFQCHGGRVSAQRILRQVLQAGARVADPGEFTRRAFLNGRIDLLQAEAVADLIRARTDRAAAAAVEQLEGRLSQALNEVFAAVLDCMAGVEASLDFPEDDIPASATGDVCQRLGDARQCLANLLSTSKEGKLLREGALVVISGKPNVGKSTLLNRLLGTERAIVTDIPGTTRDTIEEGMVLNGIPIRLVDTAGLRDTAHPVEIEGVRRATEVASMADVVLYVIDISCVIDDYDNNVVNGLSRDRLIIVLNKCDIGGKGCSVDIKMNTSVVCSALNGDGVDELRQSIVAKLNATNAVEPHAVISERHRSLISKALAELDRAILLAEADVEANSTLLATHLRAVLTDLGRINGDTYDEDLLDRVFSRFCIGK